MVASTKAAPLCKKYSKSRRTPVASTKAAPQYKKYSYSPELFYIKNTHI